MRTPIPSHRWLAAAVALTTVAGGAAVALQGDDERAPVSRLPVSAAAPVPDARDVPPRRPATARDRALPAPAASPSAERPSARPSAAAPKPRSSSPAAAPRRSAPKPRAATAPPAPKAKPEPAAPRPAAPAPGGQSASSYEAQLLEGINRERSRAGLPALGLLGCPDELAGSHARRMAGGHRLSHQSMDPVLDRCGGSSAGENVAAGDTSPQDLVRRWMASSGHRANLLSRSFTAIGVGAARGAHGRWYASTVFLRS